jgi:hypothetical protein
MLTNVSIKSCQKTGKLSERQPNFFINILNPTKALLVTKISKTFLDIFGQKLSERLKNQ